MTGDPLRKASLMAEYERLIAAEAEAKLRDSGARRLRRWMPLPHQVPPPPEDRWDLWMLLGGRGSGKTDACAHWVNEHVAGPACWPGPTPHRVNIIGPTLGDVSEACVEGPSGLRAHNPDIEVGSRRGGSFVMWKNGSQARLLGTNGRRDVERLRAAGNACAAWLEEFAAWPYIATGWAQMTLGLRTLEGRPRPHVVASTTPKPRALLHKLIKDPRNIVVHATTDDNPYLDSERRARFHDLYGGTMIGRQELEGQLIEDVAGALWTVELIDNNRIMPLDANGYPTGLLPRLVRVVVAVDPSWGTTGDECGIVVAGVGQDGHGYVLADLSGRMRPSDWGLKAGNAYLAGVPGIFPHRLDRILGEANFQGEQVRLVLQTTATTLNATLPFTLVRASLGKRLRAEPIQALYEQGRVHHVGTLSGLEAQMTTWVPPALREAEQESADTAERELARSLVEGDSEGVAASEFSPDRIDALVFALTHLLLDHGPPGALEIAQGRVPSTKPTSLGRRDASTLPPHLRRLHEVARPR